MPKRIHRSAHGMLRCKANVRTHPRRWRNGLPENSRTVLILVECPGAHITVTGAHGNDTDFSSKVNKRLIDCRRATHGSPCSGKVPRRTHHVLTLAVIPKAPRFQHRRNTNPSARRRQFRFRVHGRKRLHGNAARLKEFLLRNAVLGNCQTPHPRRSGNTLRDRTHGADGHILKLERCNIEPRNKSLHRRVIIKCTND